MSKTCEERIGAELEHELQRVRNAIRLSEIMEWPEDDVSVEEVLQGRRDGILYADEAREAYNIVTSGYDGETFENYILNALCFDYVSAETFGNNEGYFRFQMSTGGPGDEFRFYCDAACHLYHIEYAFLDWFDVATRRLYGDDFKLIKHIFDWFDEVGSIEFLLREEGAYYG